MEGSVRTYLYLLVTLTCSMWSIDGISRHACFNNVLDIQCETSEIIVFDRARYGRNNTNIAMRCGTPYMRNCDIDAHFTLNRLCAGQPKCALVVNTQLFGDPCGYEEFLTVTYNCVPVSSIHGSCQAPGSSPFFDHGYIASPNYPSKYYSDAECTWHLAVQPRQTIRVTIFDFELDVKRQGRCFDYLEIETRGQSVFKDCGALGKQSITVDSNTALIRFKTGQSSLTQRGYFIFFEAVGPGCPDLSIPMNGTVVYRMFNGELTANVTCLPGFVFIGSDHATMMLRCKGSEWNLPVSTCVATTGSEEISSATSLGTTSLVPTGPNILTSEANDLVKSGSIIGIALGVVSALLLITLLLVLSIYLHRRCRADSQAGERELSFAHFLVPSALSLCHERPASPGPSMYRTAEEEEEYIMRKKAERKLDQMRVVFNNLQENALNDDVIQHVMDPSLNVNTPSNLRKGKKVKKNKNYKEDELQGRNLLSPPCYADDDDYDSPKDVMSETYMKYPMIVDDTYKSVWSRRAGSRAGKLSLCRSRDSYLDGGGGGGVDSAYEWDEFDLVGRSRPRGGRPSRTRSGIWDNRSAAVTMTTCGGGGDGGGGGGGAMPGATSPLGGRGGGRGRRGMTQSAPDILELLGDQTPSTPSPTNDGGLYFISPPQQALQSPVRVCPVHNPAGLPGIIGGSRTGNAVPQDDEPTYFSTSERAARAMSRSATLGGVPGHRTLQSRGRSSSKGRVSRC